MQKKKADGHKLCRSCRFPTSPAQDESPPSPSPSPSSPPPTLFGRIRSPLSPLSERSRFGIIALAKKGESRADIARDIGCSLNTVGHWVQQHNLHGNVKDQPRAGRKRKTDENCDSNIVDTALEETSTRPKKIKRDQQLAVSARTIRRRLNDNGVFGRVAKKEYPFKAAHIRKRLSFANGYGNWKDTDWDQVLFSDETHIEMGPHGQGAATYGCSI